MLGILSCSTTLTTLSPSEWRLRGLRVGSPFSWTAASRFDALRLSFDGLRMVSIVEPLNALSPSKGASPVRLALQPVPAKWFRLRDDAFFLFTSSPCRNKFICRARNEKIFFILLQGYGISVDNVSTDF